MRDFFFFFFNLLLIYMCNIYKYIHLFMNAQISSKSSAAGGSAEQPQQGQDGIALNRPKPHPSGKIE